jgi:hypothetical protein
MDGNIELKCDISAEDYEKGSIWTKSAHFEPHFLLLDGKDSFFG